MAGGMRVEDDNGIRGLLGLAVGIGLGLWSMVGHGGIATGLLAIVVMVASMAWLSFNGF